MKLKRIISIHAPREGGDSEMATISGYLTDFNPRPPRGGRLIRMYRTKRNQNISIHAPREGGDCIFVCPGPAPDISIHAPREGGDDI